MRPKNSCRLVIKNHKFLLLLGLLIVLPEVSRAQLMIVGIDEKVHWDTNGATVFSKPGNDLVSIIDVGTDSENPEIVTELPLTNSVFGPPTNLAITPDASLAIVANAMTWTHDGTEWKANPDDRVHLIQLDAIPPKPIGTVQVGKQPSGLSINREGNLALVANRGDHSISVLSIVGSAVTLIDTIDMGEQVAHVAFTPNGRRALAVKFASHKVAILDVDGQKVTDTKQDIPVGLWPYNIAISPDGRLALTADNGNAGVSDGHVDTVSVIDLEATPPRAIDRIVVGDAPEGLAISPTGKIAVAILLRGSGGVPEDAWFTHSEGSVVVLKLDGKKVSKINEVKVGRMPEGAVFSRDGSYLYVGNFNDDDISILRVNGTQVHNTGKRIKLSGSPASMRGIF